MCFTFAGVETVRRASAALFGSLPHGITEADEAGEMYLKVPKSSDIDKTGCEKPPDHQCEISKDTRCRQDVWCNKHVVIL